MGEEATPTAATEGQDAIKKATLKMAGTLPSGEIIVMKELSGVEEIQALQEGGEDQVSPIGRARHGFAQVLRSFLGTRDTEDGPLKEFDPSKHTPESFRGIWSAADYRLVELLYLRCNRPTEDEAEAFLKSARRTA
jgi:hypothetical protein